LANLQNRAFNALSPKNYLHFRRQKWLTHKMVLVYYHSLMDGFYSGLPSTVGGQIAGTQFCWRNQFQIQRVSFSERAEQKIHLYC